MKRILLALSIFLLCGCTNEYTLTLNDDLTLSEKIVLTETNLNIKNAGFTPSKYVFDMKMAYKKDKRFDLYEIKEKIKKDTTAVTLIQKNIDYGQFSIYSFANAKLFRDIKITLVDNIFTLETVGNNSSVYFSNDENSKDIKNTATKIIIKSNFKVIESNADSNKNDTYIWNFDINSQNNLKISFDTKKSFFRSLKGFLKNNIMYISILGMLILTGLYIYYLNKKNNRI